MYRARLAPTSLRALPLALALVGLSACSTHPGANPGPSADGGTSDAGSESGFDDATAPDAASQGTLGAQRIEIAVGDWVFDARAAGPEDGELVLLLHGFPQSSYEWRRQLDDLAAAGYRAVAPDQRGYSPRARPEEVDAYDVLLLAGDAVGMADALGADTFHVVGHDWGAAVAWVVAKVAEARVLSLTALSVPHPDAFAIALADTTSCQYEASAYFDFFVMDGAESTMLANDAALLRTVLDGVPQDAETEYLKLLGTEEALGTALNWYRANVGARMLTAPALGPVAVPTLYMWSDADIALCRDGADLTADYVTGPYQFEILQGVNHWIPDTEPGLLSGLLLPHLESHTSTN